jgi:hypothetical protein
MELQASKGFAKGDLSLFACINVNKLWKVATGKGLGV